MKRNNFNKGHLERHLEGNIFPLKKVSFMPFIINSLCLTPPYGACACLMFIFITQNQDLNNFTFTGFTWGW